MSISSEIRAIVQMSKAQIEQEIARLSGYTSEFNDLKSRINSALEGSTQQEVSDMLQRLDQNLEKINSSLTQLNLSKEKLDKVLTSL